MILQIAAVVRQLRYALWTLVKNVFLVELTMEVLILNFLFLGLAQIIVGIICYHILKDYLDLVNIRLEVYIVKLLIR
jgi:hypothetical protein